MKKIKFLFFFGLINFIIFEIFSLSMCNLLSLCNSPNYSFTKNETNHWINHNIYGAWHKKNTNFSHKSSCFSANYYFNNYGAKDKDRNSSGKNRTLVVGDSYVEGYGVDNDKNFSYHLENDGNNDVKYLNFSTSGYFGSTQYYVLIKNLLNKIEFDRVILFLNPGSDFKDDSFEFGKVFHYKKYRPYLDLSSNQIFYYKESNKNLHHEPIKLKNILDNFTYSYKFLRYLKNQITVFFQKKKVNQLTNQNEVGYVSYYEKYPKDTFEILKKNLFNINKILSENNIKFIVSTIPSKKDLIYFNYNANSKNNLDINLKNYLDNLEVKFFEIIKFDQENELKIKNYFICSDHLNEEGQKIFANIVKERLISINEKF